MFGTTFDGFYSIDRTTAVCTLIASGTNYPNSLSFVPAGTLDPNTEALVGYQGDQYLRINTTTGAIQNVGTSIGMGYSSSGDIVSVKGGGTYLTVTGGDCETDCLLEVNPSTGAFLKNWGPTGHSSVFGLAFWAGKVTASTTRGSSFRSPSTAQRSRSRASTSPAHRPCSRSTARGRRPARRHRRTCSKVPRWAAGEPSESEAFRSSHSSAQSQPARRSSGSMTSPTRRQTAGPLTHRQRLLSDGSSPPGGWFSGKRRGSADPHLRDGRVERWCQSVRRDRDCPRRYACFGRIHLQLG